MKIVYVNLICIVISSMVLSRAIQTGNRANILINALAVVMNVLCVLGAL